MILDDVKDQVLERVQSFWIMLQESSLYIQIREKYENLSPNAQKATLIGTSVLFALILLSLPYGYYSSSSEHIDTFEEKRETIRDLFQTTREAANAPGVQEPMDAGALQARASQLLEQLPLTTEQKQEAVSPYNGDAIKDPMIPPVVKQNGAMVKLQKLNLDQIVEIGAKLQGIHPSIKLVGVEITASLPDPHYFDVVYKIVSFMIPVEAPPLNIKPGTKAPIKKGPSK